jgi:hypothetical protein
MELAFKKFKLLLKWHWKYENVHKMQRQLRCEFASESAT